MAQLISQSKVCSNKIFILFIEEDFRKKIVITEQENVNLKIEVASLKAANTQQKRKVYIFLITLL